MNEKKGFTLIELLAVIVILAIIALIAVPVVMNIITKANKSAFKDSAYGIIKAGELNYSQKLLDLAEMGENMIFEFPNNIGDLQIKGDLPNSGKMVVTKDGDIAIAISNGKYCVKKGYDDKDVTIDENISNCEVELYRLGDIVYYNPVTNNKCSDYNTNNSNIGVTDGCLKWYVYRITNNNLGLLLDHNTTASVPWITKEDYEAAGGLNWNTNADVKATGPITLKRQLDIDTANWSVNADIIDAYDVAKITANNSWNASSSWYYFDNNIDEEPNTCKLGNTSGCKYGWLYDRTSTTCKDYGCLNNSDAETGGYWTKTAADNIPRRIWLVTHMAGIDAGANVLDLGHGIRPVIEITK